MTTKEKSERVTAYCESKPLRKFLALLAGQRKTISDWFREKVGEELAKGKVRK
jgi:hypothetical protein